MSDTANPQVIVVNPAGESSNSEPGQSSEQNEMAIQYGQMLERQNQLISEISELKARLESETGQNQSLRSEISALSSQLAEIREAITEAEAEMEEETEAQMEGDVVAVIPTPEPPPEPEQPPAKPPSLLERVCHRINGL